MRFIGREHELDILEKMYQRNDFQMMILYGRRRIGKTTLLNRFSEGKAAIRYTGTESKDIFNLKELGEAVLKYFGTASAGISFDSYAGIFSYISESVKHSEEGRRHLIIIDEYPYIAQMAPEISSLLQREIDREWSSLNIMLVLCGSSIRFMEDGVLSERSPLYGRRTGQLDLMPFDYADSARFVPDYSPEDKAIVYGVTGGVPKYLSVLDSQLTLRENLAGQFFAPDGYFYEEPANMLRQEFRDISLYFSIISVIAKGAVQMHEISSKTGLDTPKLAQALRRLEDVRIIKKDVPILNEKNRKLSQYAIRDGMFRFWFRFVAGASTAVEQGYGAQFFENAVLPLIHDYMGLEFENICRQYVLKRYMCSESGIFITDIGKWRGTDPLLKCPSDIDIVGINAMMKNAVIGECKYKNEPVGKEEYETLIDRARLLAPYHVDRFMLFSLSGFTGWLTENASANTELIDIEKIYNLQK